MDYLKFQIGRLQQQISSLNASQKMLAATLVIIMIMTLYGWILYSSRTEMETLLDQSLPAEQSNAILNELRAKQMEYRLVGDRIQVAADRKVEAWAMLAYAQLLPQDTKDSFEEMVKNMNPFLSNRQQDALLQQAKQESLKQVLRRFPPVRAATVIIDTTRERGIGGTEPSASVSLTLWPGSRGDRRLATAA